MQGEALRKEAERLQVSCTKSQRHASGITLACLGAWLAFRLLLLMPERVCNRARQAAGGAHGGGTGI